MSMFYELMMKKKGMPSRYQEVEYIESTGTQYIDTGIVRYIDHTYRYVGEVSFSDITNRQVMGVQGNAYFGVVNGKYQIGNSGTDTVGINAVLNTFVPFDVTYDIPNQKIYYSIAENLDLSRGQQMLNDPPLAHFHLFSLNNGILPCSWKLKSTQIYDNGTLVRNFIPVYDTLTQKYGMWESVQGKFYGNAGTGDFKGSIVGYTVVGSPTITDGVVSGFSDSNYLNLNQIYNAKNIMNTEIYIRAKTPSSFSSGFNYIFSNTSGYASVFSLAISSGVAFISFMGSNLAGTTLGFSDIYISGNPQNNTWYRFKIKGNNGLWVFEVYDDNGNLLGRNTKDWTNLTLDQNYRIKLICLAGANSGEIDLNETYIKINNKLWFNGQQA